ATPRLPDLAEDSEGSAARGEKRDDARIAHVLSVAHVERILALAARWDGHRQDYGRAAMPIEEARERVDVLLHVDAGAVGVHETLVHGPGEAHHHGIPEVRHPRVGEIDDPAAALAQVGLGGIELAPDLAIAGHDQHRQLGLRKEPEEHDLLVEIVADVSGSEEHLRAPIAELADEGSQVRDVL